MLLVLNVSLLSVDVVKFYKKNIQLSRKKATFFKKNHNFRCILFDIIKNSP